jgi:hypothetical protein
VLQSGALAEVLNQQHAKADGEQKPAGTADEGDSSFHEITLPTIRAGTAADNHRTWNAITTDYADDTDVGEEWLRARVLRTKQAGSYQFNLKEIRAIRVIRGSPPGCGELRSEDFRCEIIR